MGKFIRLVDSGIYLVQLLTPGQYTEQYKIPEATLKSFGPSAFPDFTPIQVGASTSPEGMAGRFTEASFYLEKDEEPGLYATVVVVPKFILGIQMHLGTHILFIALEGRLAADRQTFLEIRDGKVTLGPSTMPYPTQENQNGT
jgi:hypothetical protein